MTKDWNEILYHLGMKIQFDAGFEEAFDNAFHNFMEGEGKFYFNGDWREELHYDEENQ